MDKEVRLLRFCPESYAEGLTHSPQGQEQQENQMDRIVV